MTCKILCHNWSFSSLYHILNFKYILFIKDTENLSLKETQTGFPQLYLPLKLSKRIGKLKFVTFSSKLCKLGIPVAGCLKRTMKVLQRYWRLFLLTEGSERSIITWQVWEDVSEGNWNSKLHCWLKLEIKQQQQNVEPQSAATHCEKIFGLWKLNGKMEISVDSH